MSEPIPLFPVPPIDPARFAEEQHHLFTGMRLHIGRSGVAHRVSWVPWMNSLTLPAPACHQGWSGLGAGGEVTPTHQPVSCRKCLRLGGEPDDPDQRPLFALPGEDTGADQVGAGQAAPAPGLP
ncbi:hypothetical protein ACGFMK_47175 [Amycolatopsis sp. NPDC049252]|uniref:hypothetical protein n=1 Tax=Amycolatopsis sp. NPDC049252 TaxID=3363933 RepID=UPI003717329E